MIVLVTFTIGMVFWVVAWAFGMKGFDAFLVPAETDEGTKVFLVAASDAGVSAASLSTTGHGSVGHLELHGVELGNDRMVGGGDVVSWLTTRGTLGRSAFQLGVVERALELTGVVDGLENATLNSGAKASARSRFESTKSCSTNAAKS